MARTIELTETDVIIREGNKIRAIRINEESPEYLAIKAETNNFTENMIQKNETEKLEATQADLIYQLMLGGVI